MAGLTGPGIIPEKVVNYMMYVDGNRSLTALVDADLPDIQFMSETISGAGIAGEIESTTLGHIQAMTLGINFRTLIDENYNMLEQRAYAIELKAGLQSSDQTNGQLKTGKYRIMVKGFPKGFNQGKLSVGKPTDSKQEFSVNYMKVEYDGKEVLEIDKTNMIFKVNGKDYLAEIRSAMGI